MSLSFGQLDIVVAMAPERPRPGLKPMERRVFPQYSRVRERLVQEICDAVGGECVYIEIRDGADGGLLHLVPVAGWRRPVMAGTESQSGTLATVAVLVKTAHDGGCRIVAYGSDRVRWTLDFRTVRHAAGSEWLDCEPDDEPGSPELGTGGTPRGAPGAMRESF